MNNQEIKNHDLIVVVFFTVGIFFLLFHCYYQNYNATDLIHMKLLDPLIYRVYKKQLFFLSNPFLSKFIALSFTMIGTALFNNSNYDSKKMNISKVITMALIAFIFYFLSIFFLEKSFIVYTFISFIGLMLFTTSFMWFKRYLYNPKVDDKFNEDEESFMQNTQLMENEYSVNIPYKFNFEGKIYNGWVNFINIFRGILLAGTPGSGKSFAFIQPFLKQLIGKGFCILLYDYKFPTLTNVTYHLVNLYKNVYKKLYGVIPIFYVINFDDPRYSHRINPLSPRYIQNTDDAGNASKILFYNLMPGSQEKGSDFFNLSGGAYLSTLIYFLSFYEKGKYSTLPHVIALMTRSAAEIIPILTNYKELRPLLSAFGTALHNEAFEQLAGQIASAQIPLSKIASKELFWTLSGDDIDFEINNPDKPAILCIGNNPKRQEAYAPAIGLLFTQFFSIVNQKGKLPLHVSLDEFPTCYMEGIDNLIATGRSNLISVFLGFQDISLLIANYGEKISNKMKNLCGNIVFGQVQFETAKLMEDMFGKVIQKRKTTSIANDGTISYSVAEQEGSLFPQSKISTLSQGDFGGKIADNFDQKAPIKLFKGTIMPDTSDIKNKNLEIIYDFGDQDVNKILTDNFDKIFDDVENIIENEKKKFNIF